MNGVKKKKQDNDQPTAQFLEKVSKKFAQGIKRPTGKGRNGGKRTGQGGSEKYRLVRRQGKHITILEAYLRGKCPKRKKRGERAPPTSWGG